MQIKFLGKEYAISLDSLEEKTLGALKKKIIETLPSTKNVLPEKVMLFHNKKKVQGGDDTALGSDALQITDESVIFVVIVSGDVPKAAEAAKKTSAAPVGSGAPAAPGAPAGNPMFNQFMGAPMNPQGQTPAMNNMFNSKLFEQAMNSPEFFNSALEFATQNASAEEKAMAKSMFETMKNDPEAMRQMFEKVQGVMGNGGMNPMMGGPMMPQMGSPMMNQMPPMGSPMMNQMGSQMGSPMMNPMMNPYMNPYANPYMMGSPMQNPQYWQQMMNNQPAPKDGPCSHGFYPLKVVDGKPVQASPEDVYADKLKQLSEMGFSDREANIKALVDTRGDVSEAIDRLTKEGRK